MKKTVPGKPQYPPGGGPPVDVLVVVFADDVVASVDVPVDVAAVLELVVPVPLDVVPLPPLPESPHDEPREPRTQTEVAATPKKRKGEEEARATLQS
jgi:hypothetical protein